MRPVRKIEWPSQVGQAIALQRELAVLVHLRDGDWPRLVCGLDAAYSRSDSTVFGAAVVLDLASLDVVETATARGEVPFAYEPGLLSFREAPILVEALTGLQSEPEVLVCDGQGLAHPRRFGLACHLGVLFDRPALGIAKRPLVSTPEPGWERGDWVWMETGGERVGQVVRTQRATRPVYVSPGHRVSFEQARELTLALSPKWRLPETTRQANHVVNAIRRAAGSEE